MLHTCAPDTSIHCDGGMSATSVHRAVLPLLAPVAILGVPACRGTATTKGTRLPSWRINAAPGLRLPGDERAGKPLDVRLSRPGTQGEIHLAIRRTTVAVETDGSTVGKKPIADRAPSSVEIDVGDGSPWNVTAQCAPARFRDGATADVNGVAARGWFVACDVFGKLDGERVGPSFELGGDDSVANSSFPEERVMIDGAIVPSSTKTYSRTP